MAFNPITNQEEDDNLNNPPQGGPTLQTVGTATPAGEKPSGTPTANSMANNLAQQQRQGSGRFTNLQKYIQANKQGGQRIAQQIGSGFNKQYEKGMGQAQDYYSKLGQGIQQAKDVAEQGSQFQTQLGAIGNQIKGQTLTEEQLADQQLAQQKLNERGQADLSSIEAFTQQPNFNQFQDIQAGRGINENLLALQQQRALNEAGQVADFARQTQAGLGNEAGRFELLRKSLGKTPGYTTGQQRLDQVLLGQGGGLTGLQGEVTQKARAAVQQGNEAAKRGQDVNTLAQTEKDLISGINTQAKTNEQAYMDMLKSYIDPTNTQRAAEFEDLNRAVQSYRPENQNSYAPGFTQAQMDRLGLTDKNQGVYNVFRDITSANDIAVKGRNAQNAQDIANAQDVARYQALAKVMGKNLATPQITEASKLGDAWTNAEKDAALKARLDAAQKQFDTASTGGRVYSGGAYNHYLGNVYSKDYQDLINKGRNSLFIRDAGMNDQLLNEYLPNSWEMQRYGNNLSADRMSDDVIKRFENFINEQNYNRTLGGRRETFLDTERAAKQAALGITPKLQPGEVTGTDPSLAYNNLSNLLKGGS